MAPTSTKPTDFNRALGDAKKQAGDVADAFTDAARDVYGQARESAADVVDAANTAARQTTGSIEKALRNTIETQPIQPSQSRSGSDGCWVACIGRSSASSSGYPPCGSNGACREGCQARLDDRHAIAPRPASRRAAVSQPR